MLVQVFNNGSIPTTVDKYFACHPVEPGGAECEGCTPTFTADSGTVFVLVIGPRVPVAGDYLMAEPIGGRWVAENPKGGSGPCNVSPFCTRSFPLTAFVGDGLGTHTLTRFTVSDSIVAWDSGPVSFSATTYASTPPDVGPECVVDGSTAEIRYRFALQCQGPGPNVGKLVGIFSKRVQLLCCGPIGGPKVLRYTSLPAPTLPAWTANGTTLYTCDSTVFDFDYFTDTPPNASCENLSIPMPGGGGILSVTF